MSCYFEKLKIFMSVASVYFSIKCQKTLKQLGVDTGCMLPIQNFVFFLNT